MPNGSKISMKQSVQEVSSKPVFGLIFFVLLLLFGIDSDNASSGYSDFVLFCDFNVSLFSFILFFSLAFCRSTTAYTDRCVLIRKSAV